jgi:putative DNA methylase
MPDHVHALIEPLETSSGEYFDLSQVLHSIKSYTAHEINTLLKRTGPLWEEESWDRIIRDENDYREKWEYILNNPIKAGLCDKGESYPFLWSEGDRPEVCPPSLPQVPPGYLVPVAYLWTRTVRCKNPTCGATVPLVRQTWLCKKKDRYVALKMIAPKGKKQVRFEVVESRTEKGLGFDPAGFSKGGNATCPFCRTVADSDYVKAEGCAKRLGNQLMAVAATRSTTAGKLYLSRPDLPVGGESEAAILHRAETLALKLGITVPSEVLEPNPRSFDVQYFGFTLWRDVFTPRQLLAMTCFAGYIRQAHAEIARAVVRDDAATAVVSCLSMALGRLADYCTSFCTWQPEFVAHMFDSPGLPMIMDFAEANPLVDSSGSWPSAVDYVTAALEGLVTPSRPAAVVRGSAMSLPWPDEAFDAIVTDPPYYDSRTYSNLADHFYVWHKRSIGHIYPEHFASELTPKKTEAIAARYRHAGSKEDADRAYENMMEEAFKECNRVLRPGMPLVCVYAHKTTSGWSTVINALMKAGFVIVEAWPVEMERKVRQNAQETAALASSILLVARKRHEARTGSYDEEVRPDLESIVRERVDSLWKMGITGADLVIAAVGAGLRAYTRFSRVEYANGEEVPAQKFLAEVEGVVLETLLEKIFGMPGSGVAAVDGPSRFYVLWRYAYKAAEMDAGEAIVFTYGQNVELDGPKGLSTGRYALVEKKKGKYRLRDFTERGEDEKLGLPEDGGTPPPLIDALHRILWLVENQPRSLNKFLDEARPDRERLRLLAQALAGTALEGGHPSRLSDGPDGRDARRPSGTTPAEQAALKKLLANWRAVIDQRLAELPLFATEEKR